MPSLNFKGKALVQNFHLLVPFYELKPVKAKSLTAKPSLHDNLVVHGDNLKALKALLPYYSGKVKCIYIDPPYNTGNEAWVYNDNVNSPMMQEWLGRVVDHEDLTRHDKWLCMMLPRLKLLREFLTSDGVIFVSIDDNEMHRLRCLMDEVFGEENLVGVFVWKRRASSALAERLVSVDHEYVISYHKGGMTSFAGMAKTYGAYSNPDNDPNGDWTLGDLTVGMTKTQRPNQFYDLIEPKTGRKFKANPNRVWAFIPETMAREIAQARVVFPENPNGRPMVKRYRKNLKSNVNPISTWIKGLSDGSEEEHAIQLSSGLTSEGGKILQDIFGTAPFAYSKPVSLVSALLKQLLPVDGIVLDCFAGSATTGQAVLELNRDDGGSRRFLLIENEDYADPLTAERLRRVIKGVPKAKDGALQKGLGGTFTFVEVGNPMHMESLLKGSKLPAYADLAGYVFYTATGEDFDARAINIKTSFIGTSSRYDVYLIYKPDLDYLKNTALTLDMARALPEGSGKRRLVFAPTKYLDAIHLEEHRIDFCQLPFEIYKALKPKKA